VGSSWFFVDNCNLRVGSCGFFFCILVGLSGFLLFVLGSYVFSGFLCVLVGFL
jgi:hypothetical protein